MSRKLTIHGNPTGHSGPAIYCQELSRALSKEEIEISLSSNSFVDRKFVPNDIQPMLDNKGNKKNPLLSLEPPSF